MNEYRLTRRAPYSNPNCLGHTDLSARQGYYVVASTEAGAQEAFYKRYPQYKNEGIDVQLWYANVKNTQV